MGVCLHCLKKIKFYFGVSVKEAQIFASHLWMNIIKVDGNVFLLVIECTVQ